LTALAALPTLQHTMTDRRVHLVSLGCPKNRVDSEHMMGQLAQAGWTAVPEADGAELLLVNTCAFLDEAQKESVDAILDLAEIKAAHPGRKLVVAGCLAQRHAADLAKSMPEVDAFIGTGEYGKLLELIDAPLAGKKGRPAWIADHLEPRWLAPESHTTYLKIAEGCDQACAFCIIPKLRGAQRSRTVADCVAEARQLVERGVVEVCLVAQDLTHYGVDLAQPDLLAELVRGLGRVDGLRWVRLMYAYPHNCSDALLDAIAETDNCCKYLDMPLQHAADNVLARMKRLTRRAEIEALLERMRARIPGLSLRTTLLVGHPGETEADFAELVDFVQAQRFAHAGVFAYSREDGTLAARQDKQIPSATKKARQAELLRVQEAISAELLAAQVGRDVEVLVDGVSDETELLLQGRTAAQAPEIDGVVYINDAPADIGRGQLRTVRITASAAHDLVGHVVA
jgi:ribosomal protein S12 methylthiotransferase